MTQNKQELTFVFSIEEANYILAALQELPAKISNPLTTKIQQQANAQLQPSEGAQGATVETNFSAGTNGPAE